MRAYLARAEKISFRFLSEDERLISSQNVIRMGRVIAEGRDERERKTPGVKSCILMDDLCPGIFFASLCLSPRTLESSRKFKKKGGEFWLLLLYAHLRGKEYIYI